MARSRDVSLVIRAKNETDRALKSITGALGDLKTAFGEVEARTDSSNTKLAKIGATARNLEKVFGAASGRAEASFEKMGRAVDEASAAFDRQQAKLKETEAAYKAVKSQMQSAQAVIERTQQTLNRATRLRDALGIDPKNGDLAGLEAKLKAAQAGYRGLASESDRLSASLSRQSGDLNESEANLNRLKAAAAAGQAQMRQFGENSNRAANHVRRANMELGKTGPTAHAASRGLSSAASSGARVAVSFESIYGKSRQAMSVMQRIRGEVLAMATAYFGLYGAIEQVSQVLDTLMAKQAVENRLSAMFAQDQARVAQEMDWVRQQARRLGIEFSVLGEQYAKFAVAADLAGFSNEAIRESFLGVAEAGRVMKLSNDQLTGTFRALEQMISKGKVQAEELRLQLGDRLPGAFGFMARALGVSTAELDKMLEQGEVVADEQTLTAFAQTLTKQFGAQLPDALKTSRSEIGKFEQAVFEARERVAEGGFEEAFATMLQSLREFLESDSGVEMLDGIGAALVKITQLIPSIVENFDLILTIFQGLVAIKIGQVFTSLSASLRGTQGMSQRLRADILALEINMQRLAMTTNGPARLAFAAFGGTLRAVRPLMIRAAAAARTLWAAIGGLPGLIVTGVTYVLTGILGDWIGSAQNATAVLATHRKAVEQVKNAYREAGDEALSWSDKIKQLSETELIRAQIDATDKLAASRRKAADALVPSSNFSFSDNQTGSGFDISPLESEWRKIISTFRSGEMSVADLREEIDRLREAGYDFDGANLDKAFKEIQENTEDLEISTKQGAAALRLIAGTASDADHDLLGLSDAIDSVNRSARVTSLNQYTEAMEALRDAIPETKAFDDLRNSLQDVNSNFVQAWRNADTFAQKLAAVDAYLNAGSAAQDSYLDSVDYGGAANRINSGSGGNLERVIETSFVDLFKSYFPDQAAGLSDGAISALRQDSKIVQEVTESYLRTNARALQQAGQAATETNLLLSTMFGSQGAISLLQADRGAAASSVVQGEFGGQSVGQVIGAASRSVGVSDGSVAVEERMAELVRDRTERQREYNEAIDRANAARGFEVTQLERSALQQQIAQNVRDAELKAIEQGVSLGETRRQQIADSTVQLFEANRAQEGAKAIEEARTELARERGEVETRQQFIDARIGELKGAQRAEMERILGLTWDVQEAERQREAAMGSVDNLREQRDILMEMIEYYEAVGESGRADELRQQLEAVNAQFIQAINNAILFMQSVGGPEADLAIQKLQQMRDTMQGVGEVGQISARQINQNFASGAVNAFEGFVKNIRDGEGALKSLGMAFRQFASQFLIDIGKMILQQLIFNAISGGTGGGGAGGIGGAIAGFFNTKHDGGMIGQGNAGKSVAVSAFSHAVRYHTGGVVGLAPNERPIIAELGEEVLTEDDPRHRNNMGKQGRAEAPLSVKNVNVFDPAEVASAMLEDEAGQQVFLNFISANRRAIGGTLG